MKYTGNYIEYLENVLSKWKSFKKSNGGLIRAISDLLDEYRVLKAKIDKH